MECNTPLTYTDYDRFLVCSAAQIEMADPDLAARCDAATDVIVLRQITLASGTYKITARCADLLAGQSGAEPMIEVLE